MYFTRKVEKQIRDFISLKTEHKDVLLVAGARQVGKSTTLAHLLSDIPNVLSINLQEQHQLLSRIDETNDFKQFEELLKFELDFKPNGSLLYIDEAQTSKKLGSYVRFMKEKWSNCTTILSGSMMTDLFRDKYPVGRVKEVILRPFTFEEYLGAKNKTNLLELLQSFQFGDSISEIAHSTMLEELQSYFTIGGLPEVISDNIQGLNWIERRSVVINGFQNDFALRYGSEKAAQIWKAFQAISQYLGSPSKYTHVISSGSSGYKAVPEMLSQLEKWHLILHAEQRGDQPESDLFPKRYLFDIGTAQEFRYSSRPLPLLHDSPSPEVKQALGGLIENYVAKHLLLFSKSLQGYKETSYEIDFILKEADLTIPLEVKASQKNKKSQFGNLLKYCEKYKVNYGVCFNLAPPHLPNKTHKGPVIFSIPIYLLEQLPRLLQESR